MALTTQTKRGLLRKLASEATDEGLTLLQKLTTGNATAQDNAVNGDVASTSANGHSVTFSIDKTAGHGASELADLYAQLLDIYEDCLVLLTADGITSPSDAQILSRMLEHDSMNSTRSFRTDFSTYGMASTS